jgi:predicted SprT family Zn-dependent metalloprotease
VARKGRTYAHVITDDGTEVRVPYALLSRVVGAPKKHVQGQTDTLRTQFHAGDRVHFSVGATVLSGVISRLNPRAAHVICEDDREYRVPYARLTTLERQSDTDPGSRQRTDGELDAIAARASAWIAAHHLKDWSFQFDHATKRAGCCHYRARVISLAHAYARYAADEEIDDTILHEIAHALVGKAHGHDQVWQAKAVALGCSGNRCHDVQFIPPRYIVTCEHACWITTAERRKRGAVCRTCHGQVRYATYTEERWQRATTGS